MALGQFNASPTRTHLACAKGVTCLSNSLLRRLLDFSGHVPKRSDYGIKVIPTGIATGLDIGLSNLSLKTITLSFYTICKSSSLIFVLFAFIFRLETLSYRLIDVILLIFRGVLLMVATETQFVLSGLILVLSASAFGGLRCSLTQLLLKNKKMGMDNPAATVYWLAPVKGVSLAIASAIVDHWTTVLGSRFFDGMAAILRTMFFLITPGVIAFFMVMSEFYIIQRAGVVPMSIAGIAKEITTITISAWFFGDELTPLNITGVAITVCDVLFPGNSASHRRPVSIIESVDINTGINEPYDSLRIASNRSFVQWILAAPVHVLAKATYTKLCKTLFMVVQGNSLVQGSSRRAISASEL